MLKRFLPLLPWLAGMLALTALAVVLSIGWAGRQPVAIDLPVGSRLAILPFACSGPPADAWQRWGLSTMVAEALAQTPTLRVVSAERLRTVIQQRGIEVDFPGERPRLRMLAAALGAAVVIDGQISRQDERLLSLRFAIYRDGRTLIQEGSLENREALGLAAQLVESLGRSLSGGTEVKTFGAAFSQNPFLDRLYGAGIETLAVAGAAKALPYFEIALRDDPTFLRAKARKVDLDRAVGHNDSARKAAEELLQESLLRADLELQVGAFRRLGQIAAQSDDAIAAAEQFRLSYEAAIGQDNKASRAEALQELIRLALAKNEDRRAEELLVEKLELTKALGDRLAESECLLELGGLYLRGRDFENAAKVLEDAVAISRQLGDEWSEQRIATLLGEVAERRGDLEQAANVWQSALSYYLRRQDPPRSMRLALQLGDALLRLGRYEEAEKMLEDAREAALQQGQAATLGNACVRLAWIKLRLGYPFQAREPLDCALANDQTLDDRSRLQKVLAWLAYEQGNFIHAAEAMSEAKRQNVESWTAEDQGLLDIFLAVRKTGLRQPLPGQSPGVPADRSELGRS